jgi:hypothetical protein
MCERCVDTGENVKALRDAVVAANRQNQHIVDELQGHCVLGPIIQRGIEDHFVVAAMRAVVENNPDIIAADFARKVMFFFNIGHNLGKAGVDLNFVRCEVNDELYEATQRARAAGQN